MLKQSKIRGNSNGHGVNLNRNIIESEGGVLNINVTFMESSWLGFRKPKRSCDTFE